MASWYGVVCTMSSPSVDINRIWNLSLGDAPRVKHFNSAKTPRRLLHQDMDVATKPMVLDCCLSISNSLVENRELMLVLAFVEALTVNLYLNYSMKRSQSWTFVCLLILISFATKSLRYCPTYLLNMLQLR